MARPSSVHRGRGIHGDGVLPNASSRSQGPIGQPSKSLAASGGDESLNFFEKAWLFLTDSEYYRESIGPSHIDKANLRAIENQQRYGTFYGFTPQQQEEIGKGVYKSGKGAIPIAETVATLATLPFGGGASIGSKLAARLGGSVAMKAAIATFVDSLGTEIAKVGIEMLAGKKIDYGKRAREIVAKVALGSLGAGAKQKLGPLLEKGFVRLAKRLSKIRLAGLDLGRVSTAKSAVDAKIVEQAISTMVDETVNVVVAAIK